MAFSIVTPVRNGMPHLLRCVGSVRGQVEVLKEHLIQDSVSEDGTVNWAVQQPDLSVISQPDRGMYDALNHGWRRSSGDVLSWLNADEQYLPGALEAVETEFNARPDVDVIFGNTLIVDAAGQLVAARREIPLRRSYLAGTFLYALSCSTFFRRHLLEQGSLVFDPDRRFAGDAELTLSLLHEGRKFMHLGKYLALFGMDGTNLSLDARARAESDAVKPDSSGYLSQRAASTSRHLEKAARGCYRRLPVTYEWAEDEVPTYRTFAYPRANTRFHWPSGETENRTT